MSAVTKKAQPLVLDTTDTPNSRILWMEGVKISSNKNKNININELVYLLTYKITTVKSNGKHKMYLYNYYLLHIESIEYG